MKIALDPKLASEAKALVALAFRNGPIENLHDGKSCLCLQRQARVLSHHPGRNEEL